MNIEQIQEFVDNYIPSFIVVIALLPTLIAWLILWWTIAIVLELVLPAGRKDKIMRWLKQYSPHDHHRWQSKAI